MKIRFSQLAFGTLLLTALAFPLGAQEEDGTKVIPPQYAAEVAAAIAQLPPEIKNNVQLHGGNAMLIMAKELDISTIQGKDIASEGSALGFGKPKKLTDRGIGDVPLVHENEPTIASNPREKDILVAGNHFLGVPPRGRCVVYSSFDRGQTWSGATLMPQLTSFSSCSDPVLAFAPDGSRVYYAYMDIKSFFFRPNPARFVFVDFDIIVSTSTDGGLTWSTPVIALDGAETAFVFGPGGGFRFGFDFDKPWIGTSNDESQSNFAYVTATRFDEFFPFRIHIAFARSTTGGGPWSAPTLLDTASGGRVIQGSRPTGGRGGEVLVAYYDSGTDGWLVGSFRIRTRRSSDNGVTFDPSVIAATDTFELPFFLGPLLFYHRWWGSMFPDVEIDSSGAAHIVYTHDPDPNPASAEDGDVRYVTSAGAPYNTWSSPVTVNDDGLARAQGYAALETDGTQVHVMFEDHRLSPTVPTVFPNSSNLRYDMFSARKTTGGFESNVRVSDASSISDFIFIGDYNDLTASTNTLFGIWTDRRHQSSIFQFEDNTFGSLVK